MLYYILHGKIYIYIYFVPGQEKIFMIHDLLENLISLNCFVAPMSSYMLSGLGAALVHGAPLQYPVVMWGQSDLFKQIWWLSFLTQNLGSLTSHAALIPTSILGFVFSQSLLLMMGHWFFLQLSHWHHKVRQNQKQRYSSKIYFGHMKICDLMTTMTYNTIPNQ